MGMVLSAYSSDCYALSCGVSAVALNSGHATTGMIWDFAMFFEQLHLSNCPNQLAKRCRDLNSNDRIFWLVHGWQHDAPCSLC